MLNTIANWATLLGFILAFLAIGYARRLVRRHLRSHIGMALNWVRGPAGAGWQRGRITPRTALMWHHPRNEQVPLFSGGAFSEVTLLQNVFLPESLTPHLVQVAQDIEAFNATISRYDAFKTSDPLLFISVERKLDVGIAATFPSTGLIAPSPPEDMTVADYNAVIAAAGLTADELAWSETLFHMLVHAHQTYIGDATGRGLFRHLLELDAEFTARA